MNYIQKTVQYYENNPSYLERKKGFEKDSLKPLKKFKKLLTGKSVLEIGFGGGNDAAWFLENDLFYTGVEPVLKFCQNLHERFPWINILNSDVRAVEFRPETFNGIWAMASLHHLNDSDLKNVLDKFHSWLQPGGTVFVSLKEGRKSFTGDDGRFYNLFTKSRFLDLTKDHFKLVEFCIAKPKKYNRLRANWLTFYLRKI